MSAIYYFIFVWRKNKHTDIIWQSFVCHLRGHRTFEIKHKATRSYVVEYITEQSIAVQQLCSFTNIPSLQCQKIGFTTSYSTSMNEIMYSNTHQLNHILKTTG